MNSFPVSREELLRQVGITANELIWFQAHFQDQLRLLTDPSPGGERFSGDAVLLLRGLSTMRAQGATPEQIKGWFGL